MKDRILGLLELIWYAVAVNAAWYALVEYGILKSPSEVHWAFIGMAWLIAFFVGDILIDKHETYLLKRKIMKLAREVAKYEGIDPDSLDYSDLRVIIDEEGYMEVEIKVNKEGEDKDDTRI